MLENPEHVIRTVGAIYDWRVWPERGLEYAARFNPRLNARVILALSHGPVVVDGYEYRILEGTAKPRILVRRYVPWADPAL